MQSVKSVGPGPDLRVFSKGCETVHHCLGMEFGERWITAIFRVFAFWDISCMVRLSGLYAVNRKSGSGFF